MKKNYRIINVSVIAGLIIVVLSFMTVAKAVTFATAIGTTCLGLNTSVHMNDAADAYSRSGYSNPNRLMDPSYILLVSNLAAEVQYFASHGNYDNIRFERSGINLYEDYQMGNVEFIGTNNVNLWQNTLLVTYGACCTAGVDGVFQYDSITYETALRGAEVAVGFTEDICQDCFDWWSYRYNCHLADGYGVLESVQYANSFSYEHNSVKSAQIVHHGNDNIKIGVYNGESGLNARSKTNEIMSLSNKKIKASDENIMKLLKEQNSNINNVEITRNYTGSTNVITGETNIFEYINVKEKNGDYLTNSGYTIVSNNGVIDCIIDNTIKNESLSIKNINFKDKSSIDEGKYISRAYNDVKEKYNNDIDVVQEETILEYFYDKENNKNFILVSVKTNAGTEQKPSYGIDVFRYEL